MSRLHCEWKGTGAGWRLAGLCLAVSIACAAQQPGVRDNATSTPYTLHVYENLVQVPTLVLNQGRVTQETWSAHDFRISLDAGPLFVPLRVRREGEDALTVAVLVDASDSVPEEVATQLARTLVAEGPTLFTTKDRVRFFALGCDLTEGREVRAGVAEEGERLRGVTASVLAHARKGAEQGDGGGCMEHRLWDALEVVTEQIADAPGRHIALVLTGGSAEKSRNSWRDAMEYADGKGVTTFGLRWGSALPSVAVPVPSGRSGRQKQLREDPLELLTSGTGGLVMQVIAGRVAEQVAEILAMVRSRYVLEFQRPSNAVAGFHQIVVTVPDKDAVVLASGVSVALENQAVHDDPSTVPSDISHAPQLGTRRTLGHPD